MRSSLTGHSGNADGACDFHSTKQGGEPPPLHLRRKSHLSSWLCRHVQVESGTDPEPRQGGCMDLRTRFLRAVGRKSSGNFLGPRRYSQGPFGNKHKSSNLSEV